MCLGESTSGMAGRTQSSREGNRSGWGEGRIYSPPRNWIIKIGKIMSVLGKQKLRWSGAEDLLELDNSGEGATPHSKKIFTPFSKGREKSVYYQMVVEKHLGFRSPIAQADSKRNQFSSWGKKLMFVELLLMGRVFHRCYII